MMHYFHHVSYMFQRGRVPPLSEWQFYPRLKTKAAGGPLRLGFFLCVCAADQVSSYLAHASDPRHNGVVEEVKFLPRLAEEEVNLVVIAHRVPYWLTLFYVSRAHKDGICWGEKWSKTNQKKIGSLCFAFIHGESPRHCFSCKM